MIVGQCCFQGLQRIMWAAVTAVLENAMLFTAERNEGHPIGSGWLAGELRE